MKYENKLTAKANQKKKHKLLIYHGKSNHQEYCK